MNRTEYMSRLEELLADISAEDRRDALQYYEDYFDEAGPWNESKVISELGTPETVAQGIKDGLFTEDSPREGQFTEYGYDDPQEKRIRYAVAEKSAYAEEHRQEQEQEKVEEDWKNRYEEERRYEEQRRREMQMRYEADQRQRTQRRAGEQERRPAHGMSPVLWVLIAVFGFPIWFPVLMAGAGLMIGLVVTAAGILFGIGIGAIVCLGGGLIGIVSGILRFFSSPLAGIILFGGGLAAVGFGLLFLAATAAIVTKLLPACIRGLRSLFGRSAKGRRAYV